MVAAAGRFLRIAPGGFAQGVTADTARTLLCSGGLLQAGEQLQHRRREVGVVMDDLPAARFAAIDVGDALVDLDVLAGKGGLAAFGTRLVSQVSGDVDALVTQLGVPPEARPATPSNDPRTSSHPVWRPPIGWKVVTVASCDQTSASGALSPSSMRFSAP